MRAKGTHPSIHYPEPPQAASTPRNRIRKQGVIFGHCQSNRGSRSLRHEQRLDAVFLGFPKILDHTGLFRCVGRVTAFDNGHITGFGVDYTDVGEDVDARGRTTWCCRMATLTLENCSVCSVLSRRPRIASVLCQPYESLLTSRLANGDLQWQYHCPDLQSRSPHMSRLGRLTLQDDAPRHAT